MGLSSIKNEIYNYFLEVQQKRFEEKQPLLSVYNMHKMVTSLKKSKVCSHWKKLQAKAIQRVITELDGGYKSFFRLIKKDHTARPPQKRTCVNEQFSTIIYNQSGWSFKKNYIVEINGIPIKYSATHLPGIKSMEIKELRLKKRNNKWLCDICVEESRVFLDITTNNKVLAIDLGLEKLGTGIGSDGKVVIINNKARKISKYYSKIINEIKSKQSKKEKYSRKWKHLQQRKKFFYNKKNSQVKQALHTQSKNLLSMNYDIIVVGDLNVKRLMQNPDSKLKKMSRSFGQSNVSMFLSFLKYKAEMKNKHVVKTDERQTTQLNSLTDKLFKEKVELKDREVNLSTSIRIDRDLNSALNIYRRWHQNHIAAVAPPLESFLSGVLDKNNIFIKKSIDSISTKV